MGGARVVLVAAGQPGSGEGPPEPNPPFLSMGAPEPHVALAECKIQNSDQGNPWIPVKGGVFRFASKPCLLPVNSGHLRSNDHPEKESSLKSWRLLDVNQVSQY